MKTGDDRHRRRVFLNCLILIERPDLLLRLYQRILIPSAVGEELRRPTTPSVVRDWLARAPDWLEVCVVRRSSDRALDALDAGEREAILLALELGADRVLMDDREGRREAFRRQVSVVGTLAILEQAARRGLLDFRAALAQLEYTNFRLMPQLRATFLACFRKEP